MANQLRLLDPEAPEMSGWRLDDETREIGLRGIAEARAILLAAMRGADKQPSAA